MVTPNEALAKYLDIREDSARSVYWKEIRFRLGWDELPTILLHYLHTSQLRKVANKRAFASLRARGLSFDDVKDWARIVLEDNADERVHLFFSTLSYYPSFLFLEICRRDILRVHTLKTILVHAWDQILYENELSSKSLTSPDSLTPLRNFEDNSFSVLLHRLLHQCRQIWPPGMVTVAHMVGLYIDSLSIDRIHGSRTPNPDRYRQMCRLQNRLLQALALPARAEPYQAMVYNWSAQKIILGLASTFSPPLMLDQPAYQAVINVLTASKKSSLESRSAKLRARTWPPWRIEQDGMDAQRKLEEDFSRTIVALMRKRESGYSDASYDHIMSILGGQEPDGTPTIQTRAIVKNRSHLGQNTPERLQSRTWAARVEATRDVQEAWAAFTEYTKQRGRPGARMYYAMFRKLSYENRRLGAQPHEHAGAPGDGREVLPVLDDNITDFYRSRLQPPTQQELYRDMLAHGVLPSSQLLSFLVRRASSIEQGLMYLYDSGLSKLGLEYLHGGDFYTLPSSEVRAKVREDLVKVVPSRTITDFIILLCRFAPRAVQVPRDGGTDGQPSNNTGSEMVWVVREVWSGNSRHAIFSQPLQHAAYLLKASGMLQRYAWYALWQALSQRNIVLFPQLCSDPKNFELAWRLTAAALQEFQHLGLELDPHGFRYICDTFTKYAKAYSKMTGRHLEKVLEAADIVKTEFKKLIICNEPSHHMLPHFAHSIHGVHLHAFVRSMASVENYGEIILMLEWMVQNHAELATVAEQTANGARHLRRTLIASKVFCEGTSHEARARALIEEVKIWDGWPTDDEVAKY
ncbi:uncharacterized protein LY89DRAFT_619700, partial [Mollisia scopiformis]